MRHVSHTRDEVSMIQPSDTEFKLLRALWKAGRLSAREIHDASLGETQWSYSATRKTLDRMVEKGLIAVEPVHGLNTYVPRQSKLETMAFMMRRFARDVLDLGAPLPVAAFASSRMLDEGEIEKLARDRL